MELVERDKFLSDLENRFKKTAAGTGHCWVIAGEAGIGKSALVNTFLKNIEDKSLQFIGACDSLFTPRPLAPLYDLAMQMGDGWLDIMRANTPRTELFSQFVHALSSKIRPVVVVFEDIHWADEATLDFIKFFARRINRSNCLFILTLRDDELDQQNKLKNIFADLSTDSFTRVVLTPLSLQAVQGLADAKGYNGENIFAITGGNPFYVTEILASYSLGVPENVKDSILSVYNRSGDQTQRIWQLLSVTPEGLDLADLYKIDAAYQTAIETCLFIKILITRNGKIFFKHELFRRTIEEALSPFKRIELNKQLLDLFFKSFEEKGEIERIVHHAKNANNNKLVTEYAPRAANIASGIGAHIEASKLYLTAIEYSDEDDPDQLVRFYEDYAYECYLIGQMKEAIIFQTKALKIRKKRADIEKIGNSLRFLSRLWWFDGNRRQAENYGREAIVVLDPSPPSRAKAMAFSHMAQLMMSADEAILCGEWGDKAIGMAREIGDNEILCHALSSVGFIQWLSDPLDKKGKKMLIESLDIALKNSFYEQAARAYSNIVTNYITLKEYEPASKYLEAGISYCEKRELYSSKNFKLHLKARLLLETCHWEEASGIAVELLANPNQPGTVKIGALVILGRIRLRQGTPGAVDVLLEAKSLAHFTDEHQRIIPVMIALLEYEWLTGISSISHEELNLSIELIGKSHNSFLNSEFAYWLFKTREQILQLSTTCEPFDFLQNGGYKSAAKFWEKKECLFEKALALSAGNEEDQRNALSIMQQLEATAVAEKLKMEMRSSGIRKIPRGLRKSTKSNPAQLTNRELDILQLLTKSIQNKEIAQQLFISPKTVDHHISSILFKLDVNSRSKAVTEATRLGILK